MHSIARQKQCCLVCISQAVVVTGDININVLSVSQIVYLTVKLAARADELTHVASCRQIQQERAD